MPAMQAALEILGYGPTLHGFTLFMHLNDVRMWQEGLELKFPHSLPPGVKREGKPFGRAEFDNLLGAYEVASDVPCIAFATDLIAAYPSAKVIIVERSIEAWYASFNATMIDGIFSPLNTFVCSLDPPLGAFMSMTRTWVRGWFGASTEEGFRRNAREVYGRHYEEIRRMCPGEVAGL